jgi:hypothetical protein
MTDLHGLYVGEALKYAELAFESAALKDDKVVRFIVGTSSPRALRHTVFEWFSPNLGKGIHALDGKAKIRPALEKLCQEYVRDSKLLPFHRSVFSPWSILGAASLTIWIPRMLEFLLSSVDVDAKGFLYVMLTCKLRSVLYCITVVAYSCSIYH